ncbi:MAG: hypothetical protein IJF00_06170 [Bacteroidaceae bacterium]|nr:hypothetical protein [Bacteroidaceae bacterium]
MKLTKIFRALLLAAGLAPACATAQTTDALVATLQHGDETKVFTGTNAFINAYNAAADSADIITLSSGTFNSPNYVRKSITVYGAGWENDSNGTAPTYISGNLNLQNRDIVDEDGNSIKGGGKLSGLHFEGLYFHNNLIFRENNGTGLTNMTFKKCYFSSTYTYSSTENIRFEQCYINTENIGRDYFHKNMHISNCRFACVCATTESSIFVENSILVDTGQSEAAFYSNCIIYGYLEQGSTANRNIFVARNSAGSGVLKNEANWYNIQESGIFADGAIANRTFELKYPNKYIGTDGTQVGVHGGRYPWSKIPATPRIVESNIDTETSAEGKLKVSIKVEAH